MAHNTDAAAVVEAIQAEVNTPVVESPSPVSAAAKPTPDVKTPMITKAMTVFLIESVIALAAFGFWFLDIQAGTVLSLKVFAPVGVAILLLVVGKLTKTFANSCVVAMLTLMGSTGLQVALNCAHNSDSIMWNNYIWGISFLLCFFVFLLSLFEVDTYELPSGQFRRLPDGLMEAVPSGVYYEVRLVSRALEAWREGAEGRKEQKQRAAAASDAKKAKKAEKGEEKAAPAAPPRPKRSLKNRLTFGRYG